MTRRETGTPANPHGSRTGKRRSGARPRRATTLPPQVVNDARTLPADVREESGLPGHTLRCLRPHEGTNTYADPKTGKVYSFRLSPIGAVCADGYVRVGRSGRTREQYAHRIVWEAVNGPIPDGYQVDHKNHSRADNRIRNLQLLTPGQNITRAQRWREQQGKPAPGAKLTADQVLQIRTSLAGIPATELAPQLGVSIGTLRAARRGDTWRHITPNPRLQKRRRPGAAKGKRPKR